MTTHLSLHACVAIAESLRQADPAAYSTIVGGLTPAPSRPAPPSQPRRIEQDIGQLMKAMLAEQGELKVRDWQRRRKHATSAEAEAELQVLVEQGLGEWIEVIGPGCPSRRVRRLAHAVDV